MPECNNYRFLPGCFCPVDGGLALTFAVILSLVLMNATMGLFGALLLVSNHQIFIPYTSKVM
jgi:hypothetical protein